MTAKSFVFFRRGAPQEQRTELRKGNEYLFINLYSVQLIFGCVRIQFSQFKQRHSVDGSRQRKLFYLRREEEADRERRNLKYLIWGGIWIILPAARGQIEVTCNLNTEHSWFFFSLCRLRSERLWFVYEAKKWNRETHLFISLPERKVRWL